MSQYGWRIGSAGAGALALVVSARMGWSAAYMACAAFALPAVFTALFLGEPSRHREPAGKKGLRVERQMLVNDVWHTKAQTKTKKKGRFSFTIKKAVPAGAVYQYRVVVFKKKQVIAVSAPTTITVAP
jgi:hypothetical protein